MASREVARAPKHILRQIRHPRDEIPGPLKNPEFRIRLLSHSTFRLCNRPKGRDPPPPLMQSRLYNESPGYQLMMCCDTLTTKIGTVKNCMLNPFKWELCRSKTTDLLFRSAKLHEITIQNGSVYNSLRTRFWSQRYSIILPPLH